MTKSCCDNLYLEQISIKWPILRNWIFCQVLNHWRPASNQARSDPWPWCYETSSSNIIAAWLFSQTQMLVQIRVIELCDTISPVLKR
ncbi:hypothetical protein AQUCO_00200640v1 [Aquilegia coerulea]|uniref:Uncharacterized protein n=1 Tax=Aquilegia coerulea TaxID=218851 RepID=A0A2G5F457_AQUCA|nr:hypothetical protein AQUCO_00200640v1 [Aquilegia coerulea]